MPTKRKPGAEKCSEVNREGFQCGAWAMKDGSGKCFRHHPDDAAWRIKMVKGGKARAEQARKRRELAPGRRPYAPGYTIQMALDTCVALLRAEIPGLGEPDLELRGLGALALATIFNTRERDELLGLLEKAGMRANDPEVNRVLEIEAARDRLRELYQQGRISAELLPPELIGLPKPASLGTQPEQVQLKVS